MSAVGTEPLTENTHKNRSHIVIRNLLIQQLSTDQLHENWAFLKRGAEEILAKIKPQESTSWIPEDLYAALRYPESSHTVLWMVSRNQRALGWACGELQRDRYGKVEFFLWDAWSIPLRERLPEDDVDGARDQLVDYIKIWAKSQGAWRVVTYSYRKLEHLGWTKSHTTYYMTV
jgi:hypothetical protein